MQDMIPAQPVPTVHDVTIKSTKKLAHARVYNVPPEEFGIDRNARNIDDCNYCFHDIVSKTRADLIAEGFDKNQVNALPEYSGLTTMEEMARDSVWEHASTAGASYDAGQQVKITEHYIRIDYEGNGKPCLYQVITGGEDGEILKRDGELCITEFDQIPFATCTPIPVPHRFFGRAVADLVIPIQREKTALKRGILDNIYLVTNPRVEVAESNAGPNTLDDLLVARPGGVVRTKIPGGLNWQVTPDITASIYPALQYLDAQLESQTGLSKQSQGLDANALQNQSATAVAQVFSSSQMRMKLIARMMAEGVKDLFSLLHGTIRKHGQQAQTVRLRNQWINVDPRNWKTRNDLTINVGLGNGSKAQQFQQITALANAQKELLMGGKPHMVDDSKLFNTASEMTKLLGHKNPDRFFNDPSAKNPDGSPMYPPPPPQQDPKVQIEQIKAQLDQQATQQKAALEQQKAQTDAQHQLVKTQAEMQLAREKAELEAQLKVVEAQLKKEEMQAEHARAEREHQYKIAEHHQKLQQSQVQHAQKMEQGPKQKAGAQIQVKHTADEVTGPLGEAIGVLGQHMAHAHQTHAEMLAGAIKEMHKPRRIVRDKQGRASHSEVIE